MRMDFMNFYNETDLIRTFLPLKCLKNVNKQKKLSPSSSDIGC